MHDNRSRDRGLAMVATVVDRATRSGPVAGARAPECVPGPKPAARVSRARPAAVRTWLAVAWIAAALVGCDRGGGADDPAILVAKAVEAREIGDGPAAIIHLRNALRIDPDQPEVRNLLGREYLDTGRYAAAEAEFRLALTGGVPREKVVPALARAMLLQRQPLRVLDGFAADELAGTNAQAELLAIRGLAAIQLEQRETAQSWFDQALAVNPDEPDALLGKARLAIDARRLADARPLIERVLGRDGRNTDAWLLEGDLEFAAGDAAAANAAYRQVLSISPEDSHATTRLAWAALAEKDYPTVARYVATLRKRSPEDPRTNYLAALGEFRNGEHRAAKDSVDRALKAHGGHDPSVLLRGAIAFSLGEHEDAQRFLGQVVLLRSPRHLGARKLYAESLLKTHKATEALDVVVPALRIAPGDAELIALVAEGLMQLGDYHQSAAYFADAVRIAGSDGGLRSGSEVAQLAPGDAAQQMPDLVEGPWQKDRRAQTHALHAKVLLRLGRTDEALKAWTALARIEPDSARSHTLHASILAAKNDLTGAGKALEHALARDAAHAPAQVERARLEVRKGRTGAARALLEADLKERSDRAEILLALVEVGPLSGASRTDVIGWLERAQKVDPGSLGAGVALARLSLEEGRTQQALAIALEVEKHNPGHPDALRLLGSAQLAAGEAARAQTSFTRVVALLPNDAKARVGLGFAELAVGSIDGAIKHFRAALNVSPDDVDALTGLADAQLRASDFPQALETARRLQSIDPQAAIGYAAEGTVLLAQDEPVLAADPLARALEIEPDFDVMTKLHSALAGAGHAQEAQRLLADWIDKNPEDRNARQYRADVMLDDGDFKAAADEYLVLAEQSPGDAAILSNLALALHELRDPRALAYAERAVKASPDDPATLDTLGQLLVAQGDADRATAVLERAVGLEPRTVPFRVHLAKAWIAAGNPARAGAELRLAAARATSAKERQEIDRMLDELRR